MRHLVFEAATPPIVLLGGTRIRQLESLLLAAGAVDFLWNEELSAPLRESQVRHAIGARLPSEAAFIQKPSRPTSCCAG